MRKGLLVAARECRTDVYLLSRIRYSYTPLKVGPPSKTPHVAHFISAAARRSKNNDRKLPPPYPGAAVFLADLRPCEVQHALPSRRSSAPTPPGMSDLTSREKRRLSSKLPKARRRRLTPA